MCSAESLWESLRIFVITRKKISTYPYPDSELKVLFTDSSNKLPIFSTKYIPISRHPLDTRGYYISVYFTLHKYPINGFTVIITGWIEINVVSTYLPSLQSFINEREAYKNQNEFSYYCNFPISIYKIYHRELTCMSMIDCSQKNKEQKCMC